MANSPSFNHLLRKQSGTVPLSVTVASAIFWQYLFLSNRPKFFHLINEEFLVFDGEAYLQKCPLLQV